MATRVKKVGFELEFPYWLPQASFIKAFKDHYGFLIPVGSQKAAPLFVQKDAVIQSLILVYTGDKVDIKSKKEKGKFKVETIKSPDDVDAVNPSVLHYLPECHRGLFHSYQGGLTIPKLSKMFNYLADHVKRMIINKIHKDTKISKRSLHNAMSGRVQVKELVSELDIDTIIKKFSKIKSITVEHQLALGTSPIFSPVSDHIRSTLAVAKVDEASQGKRGFFKELADALRPKASKLKGALRILGKLKVGGSDYELILGDNLQYYGDGKKDDLFEMMPDDYFDNFYNSEANEDIEDAMDLYAASFIHKTASYSIPNDILDKIDEASIISFAKNIKPKKK